MKAILKFTLPEETEEYRTTMKAGEYYCALDTFREHLRQKIKYSDDKLTEEQYKIYEEIQDKFYEILGDYEITL